MRKFLLFFVLCYAALCGVAVKSPAAEAAAGIPADKSTVRVACVGDSITFGAGVSDRESKSYPALLGQWLGAHYEVKNFGASGSTLLKKGNLPYWKRPHFQQALAFKPDVAIIVLGTNDSKHGSPDNSKIADNWQYKADFVDDYKALLAEFRKANPNIKLFVGLPVPAFAPNRYGIDGTIIENEIVPLVREVAAQSRATLIDLHGVLPGPELFHDRVHPNEAGTRLMAAAVYRALTGKEPPLDAGPVAASVVSTAATSTAAADTATTTSTPSAVVTPPAKGNFHIYLLMGQSNMVGRDTSTLKSQVDNPHVLALNGDGQWVVAHEPMHVRGSGIGPGIPFAVAMLKANPNVTIGLVPCAVGGTSLGHWVKGADLYEKAMARAKVAAQSGVIKGVLWHQGESDTTYESKAKVYERRLTEMFKDLRADLGLPNLPIVVGQLGEFLTTEKYPYVETIRAAIKHISEVVPNVGYADSAGLGHKGDKLHFSAEAQKEMGARYAKAMQELQKKAGDNP